MMQAELLARLGFKEFHVESHQYRLGRLSAKAVDAHWRVNRKELVMTREPRAELL